MKIPNDPIIQRILDTGYGYDPGTDTKCPCCGETCTTYFFDMFGDEIRACEDCINEEWTGDHPEITNCPVCDEDLRDYEIELYYDRTGECIGCKYCIVNANAAEYERGC